MKLTKHRLLTLALALCMVLSACLGISSVQIAAEEDISSSDWMKYVDGDTKLSSVSVPGTHDSCTEFVALRYIFQCQNTGIAAQLENGYRYLDMRLALDGKGDEQTLILKHNFAKCKSSASLFSKALSLDDVLDDVYSFLDEHPTETVIMCMKAENSKDAVAAVQKLLNSAIEAREDSWYLSNEIPTMDEVRGKIVLATRFEDKLELGEDKCGLRFMWDDQGDRTVIAEPRAEFAISGSATIVVQDRYNYNVSDKIDAITLGLEDCPASDECFFLNFTSTSGSGKVGHPKKYAKSINAFLNDYDWQNNTCYGIVIVDFATEEIAKNIYSTNFD